MLDKPGEHFANNKKQVGGQGVTLPQPPSRLKLLTGLTIKKTGELNRLHTSHYYVHPLITEPHLPHDCLQKISFYPIICFIHSKLDAQLEHVLSLPKFQEMEDLMGQNNVVVDLPALDEGVLTRGN